jgi:hydroxymethylpyrimidine pyrophosphatase-like HAD family hydrolase
MGHAPPDLLAVADEVTGTIHEHGVVDVLRSITPGAG